MAGLLTRLGRGLGAGMQQIGQMQLEENRQRRLEEIRQEYKNKAQLEKEDRANKEWDRRKQFELDNKSSTKGERKYRTEAVEDSDGNVTGYLKIDETSEEVIGHKKDKASPWESMENYQKTISEDERLDVEEFAKTTADNIAQLLSTDKTDFAPFGFDSEQAFRADLAKKGMQALEDGTWQDFQNGGWRKLYGADSPSEQPPTPSTQPTTQVASQPKSKPADNRNLQTKFNNFVDEIVIEEQAKGNNISFEEVANFVRGASREYSDYKYTGAMGDDRQKPGMVTQATTETAVTRQPTRKELLQEQLESFQERMRQNAADKKRAEKSVIVGSVSNKLPIESTEESKIIYRIEQNLDKIRELRQTDPRAAARLQEENRALSRKLKVIQHD